MWLSQSSDRELLKKKLLGYLPENPAEKAFRERMLFLLESYPNCFERSLEHAHFTASAWVVNEERTHCLLTHHAKLNRWLQLGGHADGEAALWKVALKEVSEESGLKNLQLIDEEIFDIDIHLIPEYKGIPAHDHYDVRFLVLASMNEPLQFNHEAKDMAWLPLEKVKQQVKQNDSIVRMLNKTVQLKINKGD